MKKSIALITVLIMILSLIYSCTPVNKELPPISTSDTAKDISEVPVTPNKPSDENVDLPDIPGEQPTDSTASADPYSPDSDTPSKSNGDAPQPPDFGDNSPAAAPIGMDSDLMLDLSYIVEGLMCARLATGSEYPEDSVSAEFASSYIYHLANNAYFSRVQTFSSIPDVSYTDYMVFSLEEIRNLLSLAFGDRFSIGDLSLDGDRMFDHESRYYIAAGDPEWSATCAYTGKSNPLFIPDESYEFTCSYSQSDSDRTTVEIDVTFSDADGANPLGVCVSGLNVSE